MQCLRVQNASTWLHSTPVVRPPASRPRTFPETTLPRAFSDRHDLLPNDDGIKKTKEDSTASEPETAPSPESAPSPPVTSSSLSEPSKQSEADVVPDVKKPRDKHAGDADVPVTSGVSTVSHDVAIQSGKTEASQDEWGIESDDDYSVGVPVFLGIAAFSAVAFFASRVAGSFQASKPETQAAQPISTYRTTPIQDDTSKSDTKVEILDTDRTKPGSIVTSSHTPAKAPIDTQASPLPTPLDSNLDGPDSQTSDDAVDNKSFSVTSPAASGPISSKTDARRDEQSEALTSQATKSQDSSFPKERERNALPAGSLLVSGREGQSRALSGHDDVPGTLNKQSAPVTAAKQPRADVEKAATEEKKPAPQDKKPAADEKKPAAGEKKPATEEQKPAVAVPAIDRSEIMNELDAATHDLDVDDMEFQRPVPPQVTVDRPESSVDPSTLAQMPTDDSPDSCRERALIAAHAARAASQSSQLASFYSAAASNAASEAAFAASHATQSAARARIAVEKEAEAELTRAMERAVHAEERARQLEEKSASAAAHATAHRDIAEQQGRIAEEASKTETPKVESASESMSGFFNLDGIKSKANAFVQGIAALWGTFLAWCSGAWTAFIEWTIVLGSHVKSLFFSGNGPKR